MTTSKRLAEKKVGKFDKNITRRGSVRETATKKGSTYPVALYDRLLCVRSFVSDHQEQRTSGGMAED
ncbi:stress-associated endoplasmic reticulum protein 2-like protein [Tanacetum coccineum]